MATKRTPTGDHDALVKNDIMKVPSSTPRPHANGCVGCRREGVCIQCGAPTLHKFGRCKSGACASCCPLIHTHANNDPQDIC